MFVCYHLLLFCLSVILSLREHPVHLINVHCVSKKYPPLNSLQLYQILTDFRNFFTAGKRRKFATKPIRHCPPHLRHVATLSWKIGKSNFLQMWKKMQTNCNF